MGDFVRTMHTTSGLLDALTTGTTLEDAQRQVLEYVRTWVPEPGKARSRATRSARTRRSSTATCPSSSPTCTTA